MTTTTTDRAVVRVEGLTKRYGSLCAVDGVSFAVGKGETFGLLGPNGAGKTTTISMLTGALRPDAGVVFVHEDVDPRSPTARARLGLAPQELALYDTLSAEENVRFFARLYGLRGRRLEGRTRAVLDLVGLTERRRDRVVTYSGGMKRRLNLACALVHEPEILVCDEPTAGVDAQSRDRLLETIADFARRGGTVVYTTHYMEEAQRLCDRVAIMDAGRILALDRVEFLIRRYGGAAVLEAEIEPPPAEPPPLPGATLREGKLRMETDRPFEVIGQLGRMGLSVTRLRLDLPDLGNVFLHLTGRGLRD